MKTMAKQKAPTVNLEEEAVKRIFAALLTEFRQKGYGTEELHNGYEGLSPVALKEICSADGRVSEVDFDLAMKDLEQDDLVKTGPMEAYDNPPGSYVMVIALFSKNEYAYLTEKGYKAATRVKLARAAGTQHVHISGNFHQSPIGVGNHISQSVSISAASSEMFDRLREEIRTRIEDVPKRSEALVRLDALEAAPDRPSKLERYTQLVGVLGDHITVLSFLLTPCSIAYCSREGRIATKRTMRTSLSATEVAVTCGRSRLLCFHGILRVPGVLEDHFK